MRNFVRNEDVVRFNRLLKLLAAQIGGMVNINELSNSCGLSYKKTEEYLYLLEQMYIIRRIEPYYTNKRKVIGKMRKLYFTDIGLRNLIYNNFNEIEIRTDNGALFENYVFLELQRNLDPGMYVNFYRSVDGAEVDFVIHTLHNLQTIEVKFKNMKKQFRLKVWIAFVTLKMWLKRILLTAH